jgi:hypothetical protein
VSKKEYFLSVLVLSAGLWTGCEHATKPTKAPEAPQPAPPVAVTKPPTSPDTVPKVAVRGDFDGDGRAEWVWLEAPEVTDEMECKGECTSYLRFSEAALPAIAQKNCIGGQPENLGDLNDNGGDEIGLLPEWFTSCWTDYYVFTYRAGKWERLVKPFSTHCNQWEADIKPIEKDPARKGYVLIRYTEFADTTFAVRTKSVPVQ